MSKMTFKLSASFDMTAIIDPKSVEKGFTDLREAIAHPDFRTKTNPRDQALTLLVLQAADRSLEEGIAEMLRTMLRVGLNETLADELACKEEGLTIKVSPVKMVCDGIQANPI